jgi:hypothetical protein
VCLWMKCVLCFFSFWVLNKSHIVVLH